MMRKRIGLLAVTAVAAFAVACSSSEELTPTPSSVPAPTATPVTEVNGMSIVDIAVEDGRFETLVAAVTAADLAGTLSGDGPFTVFAPTDEAFGALPEGTVESLLGDVPALTDVLTYHVVSGSVVAADVLGLSSAPTLQGSDVSVRVENGNVFINDAQVLITDILASNGVIHVIDGVLLPPADETPAPAPTATPEAEAESEPTIVDIAVSDGRFTTLVTALQAADLAGTLSGDGPFTVFAPTDEAFAGLPAGTVETLLADIPALTDVLTYHVVSGSVLAADVAGLSSAPTLQGSAVSVRVEDGDVFINDAEVVITDIVGSNGVIHVIDAVLLPPSAEADETPVPTATETPEPVIETGSTIVDIAAGDDRFSTLVVALQAAGLLETLSDGGPFTVFAPTDEAFAALPDGTVESLLNDIPALTDVLLYHVLEGAVDAETALGAGLAATAQGSKVVISDVLGNVVLNHDALVIERDIAASNGIIHVINRVLIP